MLERVTISDEDDDFVRIQQTDATGICVAVCVVPKDEWQQLKARILSSGQLHGDFNGALTYLVGLWCLLEQS